MAQIKYTKMELRSQNIRLGQLEKYLPTLQLKKAMLQLEINQCLLDLEKLQISLKSISDKIAFYASLYSNTDAKILHSCCQIKSVKKHFENIAGVEIPVFESVVFIPYSYAFFDTPFWIESGVQDLQKLIEYREQIKIFQEKKRLLEKELREVSIRVNLFEKIMIPRTKENIKKIKIFLGDQQLAAVSQAKASKKKILQRKKK